MSFDPSGETLGFLCELEGSLRERGHEPHLLVYYAYYCDHSGKEIINKHLSSTTRYKRETADRNTAVLERLGVVRVAPGYRNRKIVHAEDYFGVPVSRIDDTNMRLYCHLLSSNSIYELEERETGEAHVRVKGRDFDVEDIKRDADWLKAEAILSEFFKPHQIDPIHLTYKSRFSVLCDIMGDSMLDFREYCRWYRVNKYPMKKFNYGLFLLPSMVSEYKDAVEDGDDPYLHTDKMNESDSFKQSLEKKKRMLKKMGITEGEDGE